MSYDLAASSLETDLLLATARKTLNASALTRLADLSEHANFNGLALVQLAMDQGVIALVRQNLNRLKSSVLPETMQFALNLYDQSTAEHNRRLSRTLHQAVSLFKAANLRAIPYKGLLLGAMVYGDIALRKHSCDVDFLVHSNDYLASKQLFISRGFTLVDD